MDQKIDELDAPYLQLAETLVKLETINSGTAGCSELDLLVNK